MSQAATPIAPITFGLRRKIVRAATTGSASAKAVLMALDDIAGPRGKCMASLARLGSVCELSRNTVRRAVRLLQSIGFVSVARRPGRTQVYRFVLHHDRMTSLRLVGEDVPAATAIGPTVGANRSHHGAKYVPPRDPVRVWSRSCAGALPRTAGAPRAPSGGASRPGGTEAPGVFHVEHPAAGPWAHAAASATPEAPDAQAPDAGPDASRAAWAALEARVGEAGIREAQGRVLAGSPAPLRAMLARTADRRPLGAAWRSILLAEAGQ